VGGGVGPEGQAVDLGGVAEPVDHHAGLDPGEAAVGVDLQDAVHVPGHVEDHGDVAGLPGQARAGAAAEQRRAELPAGGHRGLHVVGVGREDDPDRHLPVVGGVGGVQGAAARVEADLAAQLAAEDRGERLRLGQRQGGASHGGPILPRRPSGYRPRGEPRVHLPYLRAS
jgi:hypothetical protein